MSSESPDETGSQASLRDAPSAASVLEKEQRIPFVGLTGGGSQGNPYPDYVNLHDDRFDTDASSFRDTISSLPVAGEADLYTFNNLLDLTDDVQVDTDAMRDIHGLDIEAVEAAAGMSLSELASQASGDVAPFDEVKHAKHIIDERRLALSTLGFDVDGYSWQIASNRYNAGDMQTLFDRKIAACKDRDISDIIGWVRFRDWGGHVRITTFYPDLEYEIELPDEVEMDGNRITIDGDDSDIIATEASSADKGEGAETVRVVYGERSGYGYRGMQTIYAEPFVFFPDSGVVLPIPDRRDLTFDRKHIGDFMSRSHEENNDRTSPVEWHTEIIDHLDSIADDVNANIVRSRLVSLSFDGLPFDVAEFYEFLGVPESYAEQTADRVASLANPTNQPSLWTLQFALKTTLADEFQGSKAGDRYEELIEIAGRLLQYPVEEINVALKQYDLETDEGDNGDTERDENQQSLMESIGEMLDLDCVDEENISLRTANQLDREVQSRLDSVADQTGASASS